MAHYIDCVESALPKKSIRHAPGSGAAGGLGAGLLAFTRSEISSGIETVLKLLEFDACLESADLVITGEGRMDFSRPTEKWWPAWRRTAKLTKYLASPWREASRTAPRRCTISEFPG